MPWRLLSLLLGIAHALPAIKSTTSSAPQVTLDYAIYQGVQNAAGVNQFLGMRYASAPLGNLRFRAPVNPVKTTGVQDASEFGPICVGTGQTVGNGLEEDCLFINVFAPAHATPESNLPVWFYIPGGGYAVQSNNNYNGTDVVINSGNNLIFVNINYRCGALGFLSSEKVRQDGDLNVGLLDQRMALRWVQKYIKQFGGNPNHVVIHGPSAGGGSVSHHLVWEGGVNEGLFIGASPESPFWPTQRSVAEMEFLFDRFVNGTGCSSSSSQDALACLRGLPIETIQAANVVSPFPGGSASPLPLWSFLPVIDGTVIPDHLYTLFEQGRFVKVPLLVGDDTNEGTFFAPNSTSVDAVKQFLKNNYPGLTDDELGAIINAYPLSSLVPLLPDHTPYYSIGSAAYGDSTFTCAGNTIAEAMTRFAGPSRVWNYRYNVQDASNIAAGLGVPHTFETTAIFGVGQAGGAASSYSGVNANIVPLTMDYWISFIRSLNPNTYREPGSPLWDNWQSLSWSPKNADAARRLRIQTNETAMETVPESLASRCALWRALALSMEI